MNNLTQFYHITPEYSAPSIVEHGILASPDGYIYLFEDGLLTHPSCKSIPMSDTVALLLWKIQTSHYFKFSVDPKGIETFIEPAPCDGWGAGYHWKIRQDKIKSEFIKVVDWRAAVKNEATELRNRSIADKLGITYQGQSYSQLRQVITDQYEQPGDGPKMIVMQDDWEHLSSPPTVQLDGMDILKILRMQAPFYNSSAIVTK